MASDEVEKSPGHLAMHVMKQNDDLFKKPADVPRKKTKKKVLDEEAYIDQLGNIIQRDFFPDLKKLKAQNEYLDAVEKNDLIKLRELHIKYSGSTTPKERERLPSPATFETPANIHHQTNLLNNSCLREGVNINLPETLDNCSESIADEVKLSLDQYLNMHTSQDNESFEELMVESELKRRQKYSYLYNEEEKSKFEMENQLALPSIEKQCALPEKKLNVDTWGYKNTNYIMYVPDGVAPTKDEELEMNKKRREIVYTNTRLKENPFNENQSKETISELAKTQAKVLDGKIGVDGKEILQSDTPKVNGFSFIRTPSPYPGVAQSPLMTWGEIEGTPFRLDGSDTPIPRSQGPSFKMADPPRREQLALALAEKVGEKHRDQKRKAIDAQRRQFQSPSPRPHTSTIDRLATMSPAAQKLAAAKLRIGTGADHVLRSTYSPSPLNSTGFSRTPLGLSKTPLRQLKSPATPKRSSSVTPKLNLGIKKFADSVNTDNLLKIKVPERRQASDFF